MSAVETYRSAYKANTAARTAVKEKVKLMGEISDGIRYHLRSFLGFNFDISIDNKHERFDPKGRVAIDQWPSASELKALFAEWNRTDTAMREAWSAIPADDRDGLTAPPPDMNLHDY
jgi:hypothetical protein